MYRVDLLKSKYPFQPNGCVEVWYDGMSSIVNFYLNPKDAAQADLQIAWPYSKNYECRYALEFSSIGEAREQAQDHWERVCDLHSSQSPVNWDNRWGPILRFCKRPWGGKITWNNDDYLGIPYDHIMVGGCLRGTPGIPFYRSSALRFVGKVRVK